MASTTANTAPADPGRGRRVRRGAKARAPMVCTAGPTLSVPVRFVLPFRNPSLMTVMAGSATAPSTPPRRSERRRTSSTRGHRDRRGVGSDGSGVLSWDGGREARADGCGRLRVVDSTTGRCGIASVDHREGTPGLLEVTRGWSGRRMRSCCRARASPPDRARPCGRCAPCVRCAGGPGGWCSHRCS
jgi:hypothetical protein